MRYEIVCILMVKSFWNHYLVENPIVLDFVVEMICLFFEVIYWYDHQPQIKSCPRDLINSPKIKFQLKTSALFFDSLYDMVKRPYQMNPCHTVNPNFWKWD